MLYLHLNISFCSYEVMWCVIWGKVQAKLCTGQSWAWETQVRCALLWKHSPQNKASRCNTSASVRFPYDIHFHYWGHPCPELCHIVFTSAGPGCALVSHSDRTLPRHIWFLARLIMSNNVYGSAHPSGAPFICLDITPGHDCVAGRREKTIVQDGFKTKSGWRGGGEGDVMEHGVTFNKR